MTNNPRVESDIYDRGIVPAETAARQEREGEAYKHTPEAEGDEHIDTAGGYTVDREGLLNNYAIEPEMYYEVPGDARQEIESDIEERAEELHDINDNDETGLLTEDHDVRGKGSGII
ncbi:MAG: hypothetical protein NW220_04025 [Leptolyngbyaceae cyanobacterium bins.349]|nr:hypothetical protein [Leptolyngbyaceae cyanobacterium bins.349]